MSKPRVRFAPSPTGYLHIGGVRTALFNWLWARHTGGTFVLRIEDTDQERSTPESRQVILDSMTWLGLTWDEGPNVGGSYGPYTQMERLALYKEWSEKLVAGDKAFRCYCTKEELEAARAELKARDPKATFKYPGTCRDRRDQPDKKFVVRFKAPTEGNVTYVDKVFGEVTTPNAAQQDFVLLRSDGIPLYNFGCVVDDITMDIALVARGRDHMVNTPPQILLYEAFGHRPPDFAHLPMMLAPSGEKLSKRHAAVSVTDYRDQGYTADAVLNYLVRFGWSHGDQEVFSKSELVEAFNWEACGRGDGKFDPKKFLAIQYEHLKTPRLTPDDVYAASVVPFAEKRGLTVTESDVKRVLYTIRDRAQTLVDAAERIDFYFREPPVMDEAAAKKFLVPTSAPHLRAVRAALAALTDFTTDAIKGAVEGYITEAKLEMKAVAQPLRVAVTGRTASPGLYEVIQEIGREHALARLERAAATAAGDANG
ncbi:glutamate--tRNA ligase [soil metagenome]